MGFLKLLPLPLRRRMLRVGLVEALDELEGMRLGVDLKVELEKQFGVKDSVKAKRRISAFFRQVADDVER